MERETCETCGKPMDPNPPRMNVDGTHGVPGDPMFVCLADDKAHDDARKARTEERKRLLADAASIREAQTAKRLEAAKVGAKEAASIAQADADRAMRLAEIAAKGETP